MSSAAGKRKMSLSAVALRVGLAGLLLYLVVSLVYVQIDIVSKRQQLDNLTQQVAVQQAQNQELQRTLDVDDETAYMERVAREKLGYAKPDERLYVDMSGK